MYMIREKGRNGTLEVSPSFLVRTLHWKEPPNFWTRRKRREDREVIPLESIAYVKHRPNRFRSDTVTIATPGSVRRWKVTHAADLVDELNRSMEVLQKA